MSSESIITGTNKKYSGGEKERKETSGCKTRQQIKLLSGDARWVLTISEQTRTRCLWCQMQGLHIPSGPLTSRLQGQREQRQRAELCMACECKGNNLLGVCFSATVQLCLIVMGIHRMGTVAVASPNLCLAALSCHIELEHNT